MAAFSPVLKNNKTQVIQVSLGFTPTPKRAGVNASLVGGFTLVELLITIGILAIITTATVLIINPSQRLKEARDSTRIQELTSLEKTIQLLETQYPNLFLGTSTYVYISIPDSSSACGNLGLPPLPSGYTYSCVTSNNLQNTNGTGWIPINFASSGVGTLPLLPIDPVNTTSSGLFYTYMMGGSFELTGLFESGKYRPEATKDGGADNAIFEKGTNLSLSKLVRGPNVPWYYDFNNWALTGGAYVDADGNLNFTGYGQTATSPYMPTNERQWTARADFFMTSQSPNVAYQPNGGMRWGVNYYNNLFQLKQNSGGYSSNGMATPIALDTWVTKIWTISTYQYTGIVYMKLHIMTDPNYTPTTYKVKNFGFSIN